MTLKKRGGTVDTYDAPLCDFMFLMLLYNNFFSNLVYEWYVKCRSE